VAEVDAMSGGRVEFGIGAGWFEAEHTAYGIPFPPVGERFERLEEQLAIVSGLWGTPAGERFSYQGRHYRVEDSPALPKPHQSPGPPIIIGGGGPKRTPRLAATYGAEFNLAFRSLPDTGAQFGVVRDACVAAGRDPASLVLSTAQTVCCGRDDATIARRARAIGREVDDLRENALCGTPDEIVSKLATFAGPGPPVPISR
jgi:alkanesulfonate monooxygenase